MKSKLPLLRFTAFSVLLACLGTSVSCVTTYDASGRPVQTVDPAVAVAGIAAAGLIGYAAANDNHHSDHGHHGYHGGYHRGGYSRGGYYHGGGYRSSPRPRY